nr:SxtJ family membrane protein [Gammaproteobacteria bacterium]
MQTMIPELDNQGLRKFGITTGIIVALLFGLALPWLFDAQSLPLWPWIISGLLWAPALIYPRILNPVYRGWMKIGHALGWINSRIILGLVFYVMVLPMGLIMRLFGKDPMTRKLDQSVSSYRVIGSLPNR